MKRKLNADDVPTPVAPNVPENKTSQTFEDLGLDSRILQAIAKEGFLSPTPVQARSVPLALEGKDILGQSCLIQSRQLMAWLSLAARANTGSGKTAAYVLPILDAILRRKAVSFSLASISKSLTPADRSSLSPKSLLPSSSFLPVSSLSRSRKQSEPSLPFARGKFEP